VKSREGKGSLSNCLSGINTTKSRLAACSNHKKRKEGAGSGYIPLEVIVYHSRIIKEGIVSVV
jgi:hypothetical protein